MSIREVIQGTQEQGPNEEIAWQIDVQNVGDGSGPALASLSMTVKEVDSGEDVTETVTVGNMSVTGTKIKTMTIKSLEDKKKYLVVVKYTQSGNKLDNYFFLQCKEPDP